MPRRSYAISSETEYRNDLTLLSTEVEDAIAVYHILEEMNRLTLDDAAVFRALNREALFWKGYRSTGQTALFMNIGRIFDESTDAHSIHKLIDATITHWEFFLVRRFGPDAWLGGKSRNGYVTS